MHETFAKTISHNRRKDGTVIPETLVNVPPLVLAAVLLLARSLCQHFSLPCPPAEAILTATGASRSRAYELCSTLSALLPTLVRSPGRPPRLLAEPPDGKPSDTISRAVLRHVMEHPGCVRGHGERQHYSDGFRHFIIKLRAEHEQIALDVFAAFVEVPLGTLKAWLAPASASEPPPPQGPTTHDEDSKSEAPSATLAQIETVLAAWKSWDGTFVDFADHVRTNLRVPFGRQLVARVLEQSGVRLVRRRKGRSPDELALRGAFETFFAGAQWVGDGKKVSVVLGSNSFDFNLELDVDAYSDACAGISVRDAEDSTAVIEAFADGVNTTGAAPLALLLDNRPSNHTEEVDAALEPSATLRMRSTLGRPQNKAHVEGAFGLFSQTVPPLELDTSRGARSIARQLVQLVATTWARAINRRPRSDRGGRSRVDLYSESATDEQIAAARRALEQRVRQQELARKTLEARERPEVRALLDTHFERLGLKDPERHVRLAIARYSLDAIVDGIGIFDGKRQRQSLPDGADARYLLGIVRNVDAEREGELIAETLLSLRLAARDQALALLVAQRDHVCRSPNADSEVIADCVDRALATERSIDRIFWLSALVEQIQARSIEPGDHALYRSAARRINATFRVPPRVRQNALRFVADRFVPLS